MLNHEFQSELRHIAGEYEIEPAVLLAVVTVESRGCFFAQVDGREEPVIRFEGHCFYRHLTQAKRNNAIVRGLASPRAGDIRNPVCQGMRWKLLRKAEKIDRPAALASCAWGFGQVMGTHWRWLGYASIDALVAEARDGAAGQMRLMMRFFARSGLLSKLRDHDWAGFARFYHGPAFHRTGIDAKLKLAYNNAFPDRSALDHLTMCHATVCLRVGSRGDAIRQLQKDLSSLGYASVCDGDFGPATERMLRSFQSEHGLATDGICGPQTFQAIEQQLPVGATRWIR